MIFHPLRAYGSCSTVPAEVQRGVGGKQRKARRPPGTEYNKDKGGHELHAEYQCGHRRGDLPAVRRGKRRVEYAACQPGRAVGGEGGGGKSGFSGTVEQIADVAPMVQILDVLVPPVVLGGVQD